MNRILLIACFALVAATNAVASEDAQLHWHHSYDEALAEAKETGKPLFVEFRCAP